MRDILKAGVKVGLATLVGLLGWVVAGKILALQLGAAGVGLFGLLRQLLQNLTLVGTFSGQTALVQGIASRPDPADQASYSRSVLWLQVLIAGAVALALVLGATWLGPLLIPHPLAVPLLRWLALAMLVLVAQNYVVGLLNGHRMIDQLVRAQVISPLAVLALVFPMIWLIRGGHPIGFVLMLGGPGAMVVLAAGRAAKKAGWLPSLRTWKIRREDGISFFRMSTVLLLAGLVTTGTQFLMSLLVARRMGLGQAGHFWTAWTLSMSYVTLVLGSLGTYYMPSLSRLSDPEERRSFIRQYLHLALIAMPVLVSLVIVFKPWVIRGMFSAALLPALRVMRWMLIGDFFKGVSWVLAFPMIAFNEMKWYFWTEALFNLGLAASAWIWLACGGGIEGLGFLFFLLYALYLPIMTIYIGRKHGFRWRPDERLLLAAGLALVLALSALTWNAQRVSLTAVGLLPVLGGLFLAFALRGSGLRSLLPGRGGPPNA